MISALGSFRPIILLVITVWVVHFINVLTNGLLMPLGLEPRALRGLDGVLAAPFLHASFSHLLSNTAGLAVLGAIICVQNSATFWRVAAFITVVGGAATWLLASSGLHVGASGLIFGFFGYLVMRGWVERTPTAVIVAFAVAVTYGSLLYGLLPSDGVSWEGHLFGFLAGMLAARWRVHLNSDTRA